MIKILATVSVLVFLCGAVVAQNADKHAKDEEAIRAILAGLVDAWTRGDGDAWGKAFATDADFTVWNGIHVKGREGIAKGHTEIFNTIYKDTKMQLDVRSIRFLRDDVAVVHAEGSVVKKSEDFPAKSQVVPVFILTKEKGQWQIAVFQNTRKPVEPGASH